MPCSLLLRTKKGKLAEQRAGRTPLLILCALHDAPNETVRKLIEAGASVAEATESGRTALHVAKDADVVGLLLEVGADPMIADGDGNLPLHAAADSGNVEVARLMSQFGYEVRNKRGMCAIHIACDQESPEVAHVIIRYHTNGKNIRSEDGMTPLMHACAGGHIELAGRLLLEHGADVNAECNSGRTAVDYANEYLEWAEREAEMEAEDEGPGWHTNVSLPNAERLMALLAALGGESSIV